MQFKLVVDEEIAHYKNRIKRRNDENLRDEGILSVLSELKACGCLEIKKNEEKIEED